MASLLQPRQPFGVLDDTRLQALGSIKNRQNNVFAQATPGKAPASAPTLKRRLPSEDFTDDYDAENIDPAIFNTPSKRTKNIDGTPAKVSKFVLTDAIKTTTPVNLNTPTKRKALSLSVPAVTASPISHSRGSPKHKRISLLSNKRRSSTPFRRIDPLKSSVSSLPFSIDAALSGTMSSCPPAAPEVVANPISAPEPVLRSSTKAAPKSWFFEIHEDTPDQEASNLLQHSASVLDISSDDDCTTAAAKLAMERGKENIPPPEYTGMTRQPRQVPTIPHKGISCPKKALKYTTMGGPDAMLEDRIALREMDTTAFFPDGLDEKSIEEVAEDKAASPVKDVASNVGEVAAEFSVKEDGLEKQQCVD